MEIRLADLRYREVICLGSGARLGYVNDLIMDSSSGRVLALIVPGPPRFFGLLGREDDYILPWSAVQRLGEDFILAEGKEDFRRSRRERGCFF